MSETTATKTTVEHVGPVELEGPAILVWSHEGVFHVQDNPGRLVASFDATDGVTADLDVTDVERITGLAGLIPTHVDPDASYFVVEGEWA